MLIKDTEEPDHYMAELALASDLPTYDDNSQGSSVVEHQRDAIGSFQSFANELNQRFANNPDVVIAHDVRIPCEAGRAHIDHLLITRFLDVCIIESNIAADELEISTGDEAMARYLDGASFIVRSPIMQLRRNLAVMQHLFKNTALPTRLGEVLVPEFHRFVAVPGSTKVIHPNSETQVRHSSVKAASFMSRHAVSLQLQTLSRRTLKRAFKMSISSEQLQDFAKIIVRWHKLEKIDFMNKYRASLTGGKRYEAVIRAMEPQAAMGWR